MSFHLAAILGPILIALPISEFIHLKIWEDIHPTVTYLNGLILLTGGLIVVRLHNHWVADWTITITILGWLLMVGGLSRMFFPKQARIEKNVIANGVIFLLLGLGIFLCVKAYL